MSNSERIRPPWWLKVVNKFMIGAQRLGLSFGDKGPVVLTVPGRKSGKPRSTPVTPMTVDDKRYVVGGLPGADWVANARAAGEVTLRRGRHTERLRLVELPLDEARPLLRLWPTKVPQSVGFGKNAGLVTGPNPDEFEALAGRCPVLPSRPGKRMNDNPFDPSAWQPVDGFELTDITYHRHVVDGQPQPTVRVAFDRPEVRNAFRPHTVDELYRRARPRPHVQPTSASCCSPATGPSAEGRRVGVLLRRRPAHPRARRLPVRRRARPARRPSTRAARRARLHILEVQRLIRFMPKVVIAVVTGWAAGGGHRLHVVVRPHARQRASTPGSSRRTPTSASFDGGYGVAYLARQVGQKFAREIFFLGRSTPPRTMHRMGAVNTVVAARRARGGGAGVGPARSSASRPTAQRMLKFAFNLVDDGLVGQQVFAGEATRLAYMTDEAVEGRDAFLEKRDPDWSPYPWYF